MSTNVQNIAVLTYRRDSAGMKACIRTINRVGIQHNFKAFGVIDGNDSYIGVKKLNEDFDIHFIEIPSTIDNDIYNSNYSIGFDTALNNFTDSKNNTKDTAATHHRISSEGVMRDMPGIFALHFDIESGPEDLFTPEKEEYLKAFETKIRKALLAKKFSIIIVSEGNQIGRTKELFNFLTEKQLHDKVRIAILCHLQRGSIPILKTG